MLSAITEACKCQGLLDRNLMTSTRVDVDVVEKIYKKVMSKFMSKKNNDGKLIIF